MWMWGSMYSGIAATPQVARGARQVAPDVVGYDAQRLQFHCLGCSQRMQAEPDGRPSRAVLLQGTVGQPRGVLVDVPGTQVRGLTQRRREPDPAEQDAEHAQVSLTPGVLDVPIQDPLGPL